MIDITTVLEGRAEVVVAAEITFYDPAAEATEVRFYATRGFTTLPSDTVAAGRHYAERLRFPRLTWSRGSGTYVGTSAADRVSLELADPRRQEADITTRGLTVDDRPILLRIGTPGLDLAEWRTVHLVGQSVHLAGAGDALVVEAATPDVIFDRPLPRQRYLGLGGCLLFNGTTKATIDHHGSLVAQRALCVEALVELAAVGSVQVVVSKGTLGGGEAALWIAADGKARFWAWDTGGAAVNVVGATVLEVGEIYRLTGRWDGARLELYVGGGLEDSKPFVGPLAAGTADVVIGDDGTGTRHLFGRVDDVRWWVETFIPSPEQVAEWALQELPEDQHRRCAAYLRCNEPGGPIAFDDSLHGRDATLAGSAPDFDPEAMWSTLYEGDPGQRDKRKPFALGTMRRVPGVQIGPLIWQVHAGAVRGLGPVDEGARYLAPRMVRTASDITVTEASGISLSVPEDSITTAGSVDFGGLIPRQYVRITTATQSVVAQVLALSTPTEIRVRSGSLTAEAAGASVLVETTGWEITATDLSFSDRQILATAGTTFPALPAGTAITISGSAANSGPATLAEASTPTALTFEDPFTAEPAGPSISLVAEERWDYETDLARGLVHLRATPTLPLAIAFRGPAAAGDTRSEIMRWIAAEIDAGDVDESSWAALLAADPAPVGRWLGPDEEDTSARELMDLFAMGDSWGYGVATGLLEVALREVPTSSQLDLAYHHQLFRLERQNSAAAIGGQSVAWGKNLVVLTDEQIAGSAHVRFPENVEFAREPERQERATEDPAVKQKHPGAEDGPEIDSPYATPAGAGAAAQRIYDLESRDLGVWRAEGPLLPLLPLLLELRQGALRLTSADHPGLEAGRLLQVLRIELVGPRATVYLWGS